MTVLRLGFLILDELIIDGRKSTHVKADPCLRHPPPDSNCASGYPSPAMRLGMTVRERQILRSAQDDNNNRGRRERIEGQNLVQLKEMT
jgi:hypothetical protein